MKKILIAVCAVLAAATLVFGILTVTNIIKDNGVTPSAGEPTPVSPVKIEGNVEYDAAAKALDAVKSNSYKATDFSQIAVSDDLKQAYSINNNLVGWLTIPGTEIDTAILQGSDNSRYLT